MHVHCALQEAEVWETSISVFVTLQKYVESYRDAVLGSLATWYISQAGIQGFRVGGVARVRGLEDATEIW